MVGYGNFTLPVIHRSTEPNPDGLWLKFTYIRFQRAPHVFTDPGSPPGSVNRSPVSLKDTGMFISHDHLKFGATDFYPDKIRFFFFHLKFHPADGQKTPLQFFNPESFLIFNPDIPDRGKYRY
jgi:hypothetical protein